MPNWMKDLIVDVMSTNYDMICLRFPLYLVWIVGLILAWRRRHLYPMVCRLAFVALVGAMLKFPLMTVLAGCWSAVAHHYGWSRYSAVDGFHFADGIFEAAFWGLMLAAVFGWRGKPATAESV